VDLADWTLDSAVRVSADGRTLAGTGLHSGLRAGWVVTIPDLCKADFNRDCKLGVKDIFDFLNAWFAGSPSTDFDESGMLSVQDVFEFLNGWFAGC
jgi:hypothetical protein